MTEEKTHPLVAGFPIVGIGASAGGLAAFEAFFSGLPADADPGMAFVLVQHLAPDHKSMLADLIRRCTRMQVFEVEDAMAVQPNCVYIIPPNRDMAFFGGSLHLLEPTAPRGQRLPVDFLFRSLAQDQGERAIGIVLSGTGSDGTLGVRAIKDAGGMVMAQTPDSTEFDGMPRSALATGVVDYELAPASMANRLIAYATHAFGKLPRLAAPAPPKTENALNRIFILLRAQTSHDFSQYKPSTIYRRIERRMAVHQIDAIDAYVKYLQQTPAEVDALFRDLLIGVTNFFRDPDAFQLLEDQVIPKLFEGKPAGGAVRVWSTGCSTGEEAYSIAILLQERMEALQQNYTIQVFATDIDSRAIASARVGRYPAAIAADISAPRLARFFTAEPDGSAYRIHKAIRDMLVFSVQDVLKDPPFSRLDLLCCRNLLIYLDAGLQKRLIPLFHYALNPGGVLFLGSSEGVGDFNDLFAAIDRKAKLYLRKPDFHGMQRATPSRFLAPKAGFDVLPAATAAAKLAGSDQLPLRELMEQALLKQAAPPSALVTRQGDILYLHGRTGMYLEPAAGVAGVSNILQMAREGLRQHLTSSLHKAAGSQETAHAKGLSVRTNGHFTRVNLSVCPVRVSPTTNADAFLYLVMLQEAPDQSSVVQSTQEPVPALVSTDTGVPDSNPDSEAGSDADADAQIAALKQELRAKDEFLQTTHEMLETSNEELKSSNEEMQSVNEELQSTNEELETSKEELQSVNEELATVNAELQAKVMDLSRANNDMNNLLAGTGIATVFVDHQLRILRFTPSMTQIINLIAGDIGRPVGHIVPNLVGYDQLITDAQAVIATLVPKEVEVQTTAGKWYMMRIQPYRTLDNVIEGAVLSFVDITTIVKTRNALYQTNELFRRAVVARDAGDAITVQDLTGRTLAWSEGAVRVYGWSEAQALQMNVRERIAPEQLETAQAQWQRLAQGETLAPFAALRLTASGAVLSVQISATALVNVSGQVYAIATTERSLPTRSGERRVAVGETPDV